MELVIQIINWAMLSGPNAIASLMVFLGFLISLFMIIPGEQPEKALQKVVDFLAKYSKK